VENPGKNFDLPGLPATAPQAAVPIHSGDMVGNYRIVSEIGGGSMGVVFRAFDVDMELERAIKVLRPGKPEHVRRKFEAEGKITARLDHPNIVRVYGGGVYKNLPFIQMELIDGKSMRTLLSALTRFHPVIALSLVSVMADALFFASTKSFSIWGNSVHALVHRDLKPENVLFSKTSGLKIADFGLARLGDEKDFTGWGTVQYMSPEQHDNKTVDCRSDIFSIGVMLYEMLCGARPFPDDNELASRQKHEGRFDPVTDSNPSAPRAIVAVVNGCLEADINRRIRSYEKLRESADEALKTLTDESAKDIVLKFSADPIKYRPNLIANKKTKSGNGVKKLMLVILPTLILLTIAGFFLFRKNTVMKKNASEVIFSSATVSKPESEQKPTIDSFIETKIADTLSGPAAIKPEQPRRNIQIADRAKGPRESAQTVHAGDKKSILSGAMAAHSSGDFSAVIAELSALDYNHLPSNTRDSAVILLTDAYYMMKSVKDVIDMSKKYDLNDARYNWVVAMAYDVMRNYSKATLYIDKAVVSKAYIGAVSRENLLYERAGIYRDNYDAMRDEMSKKGMMDACNQFLNEVCAKSSSDKCLEARRILKSHE
jgi:serine/threonine-protein kinase